jgi:preprotein translocase subunit YajC
VYIYVILFIGFAAYLAMNNSKKKKLAAQKQKAIENGVHVMTTFGLYGTVRGVDNESVLLEIDENVLVRINKRAVGTVVPDPTDILEPGDTDDSSDEHDGHDHDDHDGHDHDGDEHPDELADVGTDDLVVADPADTPAANVDPTAGKPATGHDEGPGPVPIR